MTFSEWWDRYVEPVDNVEKSDIISENSNIGESDVHYIGKIDRSIYSCITDDITTDEVIITDERIRHIQSRHPEAFKNIESYLNEALDSPDYILADKGNKKTGLVLKFIEHNNMRLQLVLRIHTSSDGAGFKNSIISAWQISESRWNNYIKNRKVLYKSE